MPRSVDFVSLADAQLPLLVGVDTGGTNIKLGLVDSLGQTLAYHTMATHADCGPDHGVQQMAAGLEHLLEASGAPREVVVHLGLATPGPIDIPQGMLLTPGNLPTWWDFPIRDRVAEACQLPVRFANDANAAAYGEYWQGAGAGCHSMVLLTLGTGIGGGIVIANHLVEGAHSNGAECGFLVVNPRPDARTDSLNRVGTLEAYCGSYGVVGRAQEALANTETSSLSTVLAEQGELTPLAIAQAAEAGDTLALQTVLETADWLAVGIATLIHTIDPDSVVLGGAMNFGGAGHDLGQRFLRRVCDQVHPRLLPALQDSLHVVFASLGSDAGYIGAAGLARLAHIETSDP